MLRRMARRLTMVGERIKRPAELVYRAYARDAEAAAARCARS
jgi:hypothetical protein